MEFLLQEEKTVRDYHKEDVCKFARESQREKMLKLFLFIFLGLIVGAVNGLFGAGGGMLVVPILGSVGRLSTKKAHATAILVMLPLCLASAIVYTVSSKVDFAVLIPTTIGVVAGGFLGAKLLKFVPETWLFAGFNLVMLIVGFKMLF